MKMRNKKTGEIGYLTAGRGIDHYVVANDEWSNCGKYKTLAELCADWEDAPEEPKEYYTIDFDGEILPSDGEEHTIKKSKEIGNYFSSREEAQKAVEKLKAFKRLKDGGFRFNGYSHYDWNGNESPAIAFEYSDFDKMFDDEQVIADLDICFGGEE